MDRFEQIYAENYKSVYAFLLKLCRDPHVAEDLTQETFCQAYTSMYRYNGQCKMFTWLAAIAKNVFLKHLRKTKQESLLIDLYIDEPDAPITDEPGYRLMKEVEVSEIRRAIKMLPPKYSDVLILRIYGDLSYEEIARKLGISVNSAKVIFHRAKKQIKEMLFND